MTAELGVFVVWEVAVEPWINFRIINEYGCGCAMHAEKMYNTSRGAEMAWQHRRSLGILTPPCEAGAAELAQLVEQLFRKQQVAGSSPAFGSRLHSTSCRSGETADALRSGRSGGNPVGVQISPSAPGW